ncbi:hypothetical protein GWK47_018683 [Chionoecetes opilio]|uniref:Uncharacterized protein n=1 Tax=Chionoecetes opilio TaxID=41210 RepID=A0A8J4XUY5_CHIOP|nr:hypothetical protein GWK47_018683 [Chionoecetes opilio]
MWEPDALCCFSRRTGCLVLGSLHVIRATMLLILGVASFVLTETIFLNFVCQTHTMTTEENCLAIFRSAVDIVLGIMILDALASIVFSSLMIHGVRTNKHCLTAPFLIKNTVILVLQIIFNSLGLLSALTFNLLNKKAFAFFAVYFCGTSIFMTTYFLFTVRAYYYEVKHGSTDDHHRLVENSEPDVVNRLKLDGDEEKSEVKIKGGGLVEF